MDVNVKVAVRCRPLSLKELNRNCRSIVSGTKKSVHVEAIDSQHIERDFSFDYCYFHDSNQEQVYLDLGKPMISQALEGFNGTIFAYGQTGSGKSHSMMGSNEDRGIIPRLNDDLWTYISDKLQEKNGNEVKYLVTVSFLEIYNEIIKDLLLRSDKNLQIRESPELGIFVKDLCELVVHDAADLLRLIEQGNTVRRVAATNMNEQSSRSHSCFIIKIERKRTTELADGVTREQLVKAKLNLVDLAGSERVSKTGATGTTLKEGIGINSSLTALGNVINALSEGGKRHIPYRDSQLTRLLQESLGGNAATVMIAAISPADYNYDETVSTLKYANRAKSIANVVSRNEDLTERVIRDLQGQIEALKQQLATGGGISSNPELQSQLESMQKQQKSAWEERERLSRELEEERQRNMNAVIGDMMQQMKDQKRERIKTINRLNNEKTLLSKKFKEEKEKHQKLTQVINDRTKTYQQYQKEYESAAKILAEVTVSAEFEDPDDPDTRPDNSSMDTSLESDSNGNSNSNGNGNGFHKNGKSPSLVILKDPNAIKVQKKAEKLATDMTDLLAKVEKDRNEWIERRQELEKIRNRLNEINDLIIDEKAELVTFAGLLDQNDKLRSQIQDEERAKAKDMFDQELALAREQLQRERENVRGSIEGELAEEMDFLRKELEKTKQELEIEKKRSEGLNEELMEQWEFASNLEAQLAEAEIRYQSSEKQRILLTEASTAATTISTTTEDDDNNPRVKEVEDLLHTEKERYEQDLQRVREELQLEFEAILHEQKTKFEEEKFELFRNLVDSFQEERKELLARNEESKRLLTQAVQDVMYVSKKNEELKSMLTQSLQWEPSLRPS